MINRKKYHLIRICILLLIFLYGDVVVYANPHKLVQKVIKLLEVGPLRKKKKVIEEKKEKKKSKIVTESTKKDEEEQHKKEGETVVGESKESEEIPHLQQAKTLIDQAIEDVVASKEASTWYYRGLIYDKLLRENIAGNDTEQFFKETLQSYHKAQALVFSTDSPYYSASQMKLDNLWNYFLDRGRRYYRQSVFEHAISQLEICERIRPQHPVTTLYIGIIAHHNDDFTKALQKYEAYLSLQGNDPAVYVGIAAIHQHLQEDEKAIAILEKAIQKHPFDNNLLEEQLKVYTRLNRRAEKENILMEQVGNNPLNPALHYALGYWYEDANQLELAITSYKKAIHLVPDELAPICQLGLLHYNKSIGFYEAIETLGKENSIKEGWQCKLPSGMFELDLSKLLINKLFTNIVSFYLGSSTFTLNSNDIIQQVHRMLLPIQLSCSYKYPIRSKTVNNLYHPFLNLLCTEYVTSHTYYSQKVIDYMVNEAYFRYKQSFKIELEQALGALQKAYQLNQNNPFIAQCLYSTYYHLGKRASARDLLKAMHKRKHFLNEDKDFLKVMR